MSHQGRRIYLTLGNHALPFEGGMVEVFEFTVTVCEHRSLLGAVVYFCEDRISLWRTHCFSEADGLNHD